MNLSVNQLISQSTRNQSISQSISQPIRQSINQLINRLFIHITPRSQGLVKTRTCLSVSFIRSGGCRCLETVNLLCQWNSRFTLLRGAGLLYWEVQVYLTERGRDRSTKQQWNARLNRMDRAGNTDARRKFLFTHRAQRSHFACFVMQTLYIDKHEGRTPAMLRYCSAVSVMYRPSCKSIYRVYITEQAKTTPLRPVFSHAMFGQTRFLGMYRTTSPLGWVQPRSEALLYPGPGRWKNLERRLVKVSGLDSNEEWLGTDSENITDPDY